MFNVFKAVGAFWSTFLGKNQQLALANTVAEPSSETSEFTAGAIFTLNLLQREGRLIDFIQEDISSFSDAQVGAAVRQIHQQSAETIEKYFKLRAISTVSEGSEMDIPESLDPSMIRLSGKTEQGAKTGVVRHKGWISSEQALPQQVGSRNQSVVCPTEINC
ncbi:MAG: DUF2760 domain-containing protein [Lentisphaeria bacterium]|nr:DUF2760 domain-containing protein [Lentisphaeria bacterium]